SVVEDAACAVGTTYQGSLVGKFGDVASFSFHPRKIITTGEGGMVTTNNKRIANKVRALKNLGFVKGKPRLFSTCGYNYRLSNIHAAVGLVQLKKIKELIRSRVTIATAYTDSLRSKVKIIPPTPFGTDTHTYQSYVVRLTGCLGRRRDDVIQAMRLRGIETQIGSFALHLQPVFKRFVSKSLSYESSRLCYETALALPISSSMLRSDVKRVVNTLTSLVNSQ
ncbi:MAG TPA: DegT/DnrJ/EryC1/StrS family aminotransferase, partial [Candidatus Bathyarchaeia archaeon]|nr:DegT/DnrJ/EryC1/StrS family aminotransferase [Candidatus Bathyarchaeia archaeon]